MKTFLSVLGVIAVLALLIGFRKQIAEFFGWGTPADGAACTDTNGNASTYKDGVCQQVILPPPPAEVQRTIIYERAPAPAYVPSSVRVRRGYRGCTETIQLTQYPGYTWTYTGSDYYYCHYRRVA